MSDGRLTLRVFISSPGDVAEERRIAREVIDRLGSGHLLRDKVHFDVVAWDDSDASTPMDAGGTPQVSVIRFSGRPADCDLTLVILWGRLGTPLPDSLTRRDGTRYASGTVWEYEDAVDSAKPVFLYRRNAKPQIDVDDPELEVKRSQYAAVKDFFTQFTNPDGSLKAGFTGYADPIAFRELLLQHLEAFVNDRLGGRSEVTLPAVLPNDPRVEQIATLIDELRRKNRELDAKDAEIDRLVRENDTLRRSAIARTLTTAAQPGAGVDATTAATALEAGDTRPAEALLRETEEQDAGRIGQADVDDAALRRRAAALAREQGALAMGHDVHAALAAYQRAAEYEPDNAWTQFFIGDLQFSAGDSGAAMGAYQVGLRIAEALAARDPSNTEWQRDLSMSHNKVGDGLRAQGDGPGALTAYQTGLRIRKALAARDPENTEWQRDLSVSQNKIGDVLRAQGDGSGALTAYQTGLRIREALAARDPANTQWQRDLSVSHERLGDVLQAQEDGPGALTAYRTGLAIREALAARDPANTEWQPHLSVSHERLGDVLRAQGDLPGALTAHRTGLRIREALAVHDPANTEWQRDLSVSHNKIGDVLWAQADEPGALAAYRTGLAIREALAARDPANTEWQRDLSVSHNKIGDVLLAQRDGPGALTAYRSGLRIREVLAARDSANAEWQTDLAVSCAKLGTVDNGQSVVERRRHLARGRDILARLKAENRLLPDQDEIEWFDEQIAGLSRAS